MYPVTFIWSCLASTLAIGVVEIPVASLGLPATTTPALHPFIASVMFEPSMLLQPDGHISLMLRYDKLVSPPAAWPIARILSTIFGLELYR